MIGKLRMIRNLADDAGNPDFVIIARTDAVSAVEAPEQTRGLALAIERGLRYLDSGFPDLIWCEFPTADREPVETFTGEIRKRFPDARFAFNYSSSFKWFNDPSPLTFRELGEMGVGFVFITLGGQHANGLGLSTLLQDMAEREEQGYIELQRREWAADADVPTRSHHQFSGVPYHHLLGKAYDAARLGAEFVEKLADEKVV
jgi:isocitrate lyase